MDESANRQTLIRVASTLFRRRGYAGVGLAEILAESGLPKGSLYHHFPNGKEQLAEEATRWAGRKVAALIDASFAEAKSFGEGALTLTRAVVQLVAQDDRVMGCPVLSVIQAGEEKPALRAAGAAVLEEWRALAASHARRLGREAPDAAAERLLIGLQGAWAVALAQQDCAAFATLERVIAAEEGLSGEDRQG